MTITAVSQNSEKKLSVFRNSRFGEVRTVTIGGDPWFVGKDVAISLGYFNYRDALGKHVDAEDKGVAKCDTLGGSQEMTIINESGLYSLILSSKLPSAKEFKRWVTSEILPAIRRTGSYSVNEESEEEIERELFILEHPDFGRIRVIYDEGTKLFCARDVAKALGFSKPYDYGVRYSRNPMKRSIPHPQSLKSLIKIVFIPGEDVHRIVKHSQLPTAKEFESWVFNATPKEYDIQTPIKLPFGRKPFQKTSDERLERAKLLHEIASEYKGKNEAYRQVLDAYATRELADRFLIPLPEIQK